MRGDFVAVSGRPFACRSLLTLAFVALPLVPAGAAAMDFRLSDPSSRVYYTLAVSAGEGIELDGGVRIEGSFHSNGNADLKTGSAVFGEASAVGRISGGGTVSGARQEGTAPIALPVLFDEAAARGLADRVFDKDVTFTDAQTIDDVIFVDGNLRFRAGVTGSGTVIASGNILFDNVNVGHPAEPDASARLSLIAFQDVLVGKGRPVRGVVLAGRDVVFDKEVRSEGVVIARRKVWIKGDSRLTFINFDQAAPTLSGLAPAGGSFVRDVAPSIEAQFSDDFSGIDPESVQLLLDGVDRSGEATISNAGLRLTPSAPLAEGAHTVEIAVRDHAGNPAREAWRFTVDTVPPSLAIASPAASVVTDQASVEVVVAFNDLTSGVDVTSFALSLETADLRPSCAMSSLLARCPSPPLASGRHTIVASVRDRAGHPATARLDFGLLLDLAPPVLTLVSPRDGTFLALPSIEVVGTVTDDVGVASVAVNGRPAALDGGELRLTVPLEEGGNLLAVVATDRFGRQARAFATVTLDTHPPTLVLAAPRPGQITNGATVGVAGEASDENGVAGVEVNGASVSLSGGAFALDVLVGEGTSTLVVRAVDPVGNAKVESVEVSRFTLPEVTITSPADLSTIAAITFEVSGTVSDPAARVTVNGVLAEVSAAEFRAMGVPLVEGGNVVTATATDSRGHVATDSVQVVRDLTPPHVNIDYPRDGAVVAGVSVTVSGLVNDIVAGTVNATEATVTINGRPAEVANRSFVVHDVPLNPGENVLTAVAVDESGNSGSASVQVRREVAVASRLTLVAGDGQTGVIGTALPDPLVVALTDATGLPVPGRPVLFTVRGGDGTFDGGRRQIAVTTDAVGRAAARFQLGMRAGAGAQVVETAVVGVPGPAVFRATAFPGEPALIVVDSGDLQVGIAGRHLPRPLVAVVTDAGFNRLEGVPVTFRVIQGEGSFDNGLAEQTVPSDSDGRAIVALRLGPGEAVAGHVAEAVIASLPDGPVASFVATARTAGDPAQTSISGVVLDNSNNPVPGVTLRIKEMTQLTAKTDVQGQFRIPGAPVGTIHLIADGSTADRPGSWPDLEFVLTTIPGRENTVGMPIYLLPLDLSRGMQVDETRGGTLTLPEVPGFSLEIAPGSVTFPGGSKSGFVSVTVVHSDKVPMVPNFGQQPRFIVTIQPAGARFGPPARLTLPNVEGLPPGQVTEFYSFDHDLGHFVSIGPATVREDGLVIVSNPGVGIVKAGWHCGGNPNVVGTTHDCPECERCSGSICVAADSLGCDDGDPCTVGDRCRSGICERQPVRINSVKARIAPPARPKVCVGKEASFDVEVLAENCEGPEFLWDFGDGTTSTERSPRHAFKEAGEHVVTVLVNCSNCPEARGGDSLVVRVVEKKEYEIVYRAFIPFNYISGPTDWAGWLCLGQPDPPIYKGDNRAPSPTADSFRTMSRVIVIPEAACDAVGVKPLSEETAVGETFLYAYDAIENDAFLGPEDDDAELGDCHLLHATGVAPILFSVRAHRTGESQMTIEMQGDGINTVPWSPDFLTPAISWNFSVVVDAEDEQWVLEGEHNCFPGYEMYINGATMFDFVPPTSEYGYISVCLGGLSDVDEGKTGPLP